MSIGQVRQILWITAGSISLALGTLGLFVPVLPTTPFLLLSAYCYSRGSDRFYHWLVHRSLFGTYIRNYREGLGLPLSQKVITITLLWLTIGAAIVFGGLDWWLRILLVGIAAGVTTHLVRIKTRRDESVMVSRPLRLVESIEAENAPHANCSPHASPEAAAKSKSK